MACSPCCFGIPHLGTAARCADAPALRCTRCCSLAASLPELPSGAWSLVLQEGLEASCLVCCHWLTSRLLSLLFAIQISKLPVVLAAWIQTHLLISLPISRLSFSFVLLL